MKYAGPDIQITRTPVARVSFACSVAETIAIKEAFMEKWMPEPNTGCWLWTGYTNEQGYGRISKDINGKKKTFRAHRVSYELFKGSIMDGLFVCHRCDTPSCVNPEHLFVGTVLDNASDMKNKGRAFKRTRDEHPFTKIKTEEITSLLSFFYKNGNVKTAKKYNISPASVTQIVKRYGEKN